MEGLDLNNDDKNPPEFLIDFTYLRSAFEEKLSYTEILNVLNQQISANVEKIFNCAKQNNFQEVGFQAHKLISTSKILNITLLEQLLIDLELNCMQDQDLIRLEITLTRLEDIAKKINEKIQLEMLQ